MFKHASEENLVRIASKMRRVDLNKGEVIYYHSVPGRPDRRDIHRHPRRREVQRADRRLRAPSQKVLLCKNN